MESEGRTYACIIGNDENKELEKSLNVNKSIFMLYMYTYPSLLSHPLPISLSFFLLSSPHLSPSSFVFCFCLSLFFLSLSLSSLLPFLYLYLFSFISLFLSPSLYLSLSFPSFSPFSLYSSSILTLLPSLSPSLFVSQWYIQLIVYTSQLMCLMDPISYL